MVDDEDAPSRGAVMMRLKASGVGSMVGALKSTQANAR